MRDGQVDTDPDELPHAAIPQEAAGPAVASPPAVSSPPPAGTDRFTSLGPDEAQSRIAQMLPMGGFSVVDAGPGRLAFTIAVPGEPNWVLVVALCFFWLVPGFVYWYVKSRPVAHSVRLQFVAAERGARIVIRGDPHALERVAPVLAQLPW
jgi:hypothetical protein